MTPTQEDREREPFRWCVYCDADCDLPEPPHEDDCPQVTGIYPVRDEDCGPPCAHCGKRSFDVPTCSTCGTALEVGDRYMLRELDPGDPLLPGVEGASVSELICVGCAASDAIEEKI